MPKLRHHDNGQAVGDGHHNKANETRGNGKVGGGSDYGGAQRPGIETEGDEKRGLCAARSHELGERLLPLTLPVRKI